ncbi:MAG: hypothetical protein AAFO07_00935 [Bacteroidota bacterium]
MVFLKVFILFFSFCSTDSFDLNAEAYPNVNVFELEFEFGGGSIVMHDIILFADTENPSDHISSFAVYDNGTSVYSAGSTSSSSQSYDLSGLLPGVYLAEVTTDSGHTFDETIIIF